MHSSCSTRARTLAEARASSPLAGAARPVAIRPAAARPAACAALSPARRRALPTRPTMRSAVRPATSPTTFPAAAASLARRSAIAFHRRTTNVNRARSQFGNAPLCPLAKDRSAVPLRSRSRTNPSPARPARQKAPLADTALVSAATAHSPGPAHHLPVIERSAASLGSDARARRFERAPCTQLHADSPMSLTH